MAINSLFILIFNVLSRVVTQSKVNIQILKQQQEGYSLKFFFQNGIDNYCPIPKNRKMVFGDIEKQFFWKVTLFMNQLDDRDIRTQFLIVCVKTTVINSDCEALFDEEKIFDDKEKRDQFFKLFCANDEPLLPYIFVDKIIFKHRVENYGERIFEALCLKPVVMPFELESKVDFTVCEGVNDLDFMTNCIVTTKEGFEFEDSKTRRAVSCVKNVNDIPVLKVQPANSCVVPPLKNGRYVSNCEAGGRAFSCEYRCNHHTHAYFKTDIQVSTCVTRDNLREFDVKPFCVYRLEGYIIISFAFSTVLVIWIIFYIMYCGNFLLFSNYEENLLSLEFS